MNKKLNGEFWFFVKAVGAFVNAIMSRSVARERQIQVSGCGPTFEMIV